MSVTKSLGKVLFAAVEMVWSYTYLGGIFCASVILLLFKKRNGKGGER